MAHRATIKARRTVGSFLAQRRQLECLTAEEFAEKVGVSPSTISRLENGSREIRLGMLIKLQQYFPDLADALATFFKTGEFPDPQKN